MFDPSRIVLGKAKFGPAADPSPLLAQWTFEGTRMHICDAGDFVWETLVALESGQIGDVRFYSTDRDLSVKEAHALIDAARTHLGLEGRVP